MPARPPLPEFSDLVRKKWATLSEISAAKEYGILREFLQQAVRNGPLRDQIAYTHGGPWFRLIRQAIEALCAKRGGAVGLQRQKTLTSSTAKQEIHRLRKRLAEIERQVATGENDVST